MNAPLGRNGLIGLAVGASAGLGLIAFIIYREIRRRKSQWMVLEARPAPRLFEAAGGAAPLRGTHDAPGGFILWHRWHRWHHYSEIMFVQYPGSNGENSPLRGF